MFLKKEKERLSEGSCRVVKTERSVWIEKSEQDTEWKGVKSEKSEEPSHAEL